MHAKFYFISLASYKHEIRTCFASYGKCVNYLNRIFLFTASWPFFMLFIHSSYSSERFSCGDKLHDTYVYMILKLILDGIDGCEDFIFKIDF